MQVHEKLFIGGEWVDPAGTDVIEVISPHTEEVVGRVPEGTTADIDRAVAAARTAFDEGEWPRMSPEDRIAAVQRFSDIYAARMMDMAQVITTEMGSPISFSQLAQSPAPWMMLNSFIAEAQKYPWEEERTGVLGTPVIVRSEGVGVVGAIVPWNVPAVRHDVEAGAGPALRLHDRHQARRPRRRSTPCSWPSCSRRPASPRVSSTSSPPAARSASTSCATRASTRSPSPAPPRPAARIASICGEQLKRVSLELGGKSAAIILDDADLAATMEGLKFASLMNNGQACVAQTRILASPRATTTRSSTRSARRSRGMTVGDPDDPATEIGPLVAERQQERVDKYIALGQEEGARVVVGGNGRPDGIDKGWYVQPTVFADVDNSMRIAQEEIFGPVLAVIPFDDVDDAVRIANDSEYGLAGSVWTGDTAGSAWTSPAASAPAPSASTSTRWTSSPRSAASRLAASAASSARKASSTTSS